MRYVLAAVLVLGCSPMSVPTDAPLGDVEVHHSDDCSAECTADGWGPCRPIPGSSADCSGQFVHEVEWPLCDPAGDPSSIGGTVSCFYAVGSDR